MDNISDKKGQKNSDKTKINKCINGKCTHILGDGISCLFYKQDYYDYVCRDEGLNKKCISFKANSEKEVK